ASATKADETLPCVHESLAGYPGLEREPAEDYAACRAWGQRMHVTIGDPWEPHAAILKVWDEAIQVVESEEEPDGPMPEANKRMAVQVGPEAHARAVVRSTKRSILRRLRACRAAMGEKG